MRGIHEMSSSPSGEDDEDGQSEAFAARFTKSFLFLEAVERACAKTRNPIVKMSQQRSGQELAAREQHRNTDHRDSSLEEELDYRLRRMTDIARTLHGTCAKQHDQIQVLSANARRCHDDCARLFADMTRYFRCRLSAQRNQVARMGVAMAVVETRNLELNKVFGEMLARMTCTIDDLEGLLENSRTELDREREQVDHLRRRVTSLENANKSAEQETTLALARQEESVDWARELKDKLEAAEKVSKYYELLLDASLRKLCMYEDSEVLGRKISSDMAKKGDHVCATTDVESVIASDGTTIWPAVGGHNRNVRVRASSVSGLLERTLGYSSGVVTNTSTRQCHGHVTAEMMFSNGIVTASKGDAKTAISMTSLNTTSDLSLPLIGLSRRKHSESTVTDVASSMTSLLSEPSPVVPKRKTKKKRRLTRQLRKSFSLEEAQQMEAEIASVQTTDKRNDNTDVTDQMNGCQNGIISGKPTSPEDEIGSGDLVMTEDNIPVLLHQQAGVDNDTTAARDLHANDSLTGESKEPSVHNKPKRTPTFKGLKISGNAGFANFVRDVQRKLKRPRRSKTVELADLIALRKPEPESLNGDCNL